ncbi:PREDICTED: uncharacterized protein LOC104817388 isoform X2 [Tarenaya hassleriana]|uniref:uncharacterized protein LOC104817388 isoform X2 n=1 Tax=Tarenaya hassleriana TaxID=28532 RepID=UPI00053C89AF|nr:PREDICTED: uncharacterized protein LOC104817388 isoform X2 [Tarenaya hassleriana]
MKIFNWVQRKLHQNVIKEGLVKNVKKNEPSEIERNTKAILDQVGLVDVLDNWVDGVLTIGTFGFDTLKNSDHKGKDDFSVDDGEDEEVGDGDESMDLDDDEFANRGGELDPLISPRYDEVVGSDNGVDLGLIEIMDSESVRAVDCLDLMPLSDVDRCGKKRTTLAELFSKDEEDVDFEKCLDPLEIESSDGKYKPSGSKLSDPSFDKKIMSRAKDQDSRPIKKLRQMMKRMLKRKIHPDADVGKICKSDGIMSKPIKKCEAAESIHLLVTPGPMA